MTKINIQYTLLSNCNYFSVNCSSQPFVGKPVSEAIYIT